MEGKLMTQQAAMKYLGIGYDVFKAENIPYVKTSKKPRYTKELLDLWLEQKIVNPVESINVRVRRSGNTVTLLQDYAQVREQLKRSKQKH